MQKRSMRFGVSDEEHTGADGRGRWEPLTSRDQGQCNQGQRWASVNNNNNIAAALMAYNSTAIADLGCTVREFNSQRAGHCHQ